MISNLDPRYVVYKSLVHRALTKQNVVSGQYRIVGTDQEFATLSQGEEALVDGSRWRITCKNEEKRCFYLSGNVQIPIPGGGPSISCSPGYPMQQIKEEILKWETTFQKEAREIELAEMGQRMRNFLDQLSYDIMTESFLNEPETIKESYREVCCGSFDAYEASNQSGGNRYNKPIVLKHPEMQKTLEAWWDEHRLLKCQARELKQLYCAACGSSIAFQYLAPCDFAIQQNAKARGSIHSRCQNEDCFSSSVNYCGVGEIPPWVPDRLKDSTLVSRSAPE